MLKVTLGSYYRYMDCKLVTKLMKGSHPSLISLMSGYGNSQGLVVPNESLKNCAGDVWMISGSGAACGPSC